MLLPLFDTWLSVPTGRYGVGSGGVRIVVNEVLLATSTMVAFGASFSLPHLLAKVSSLNAERPLRLGGTNWPSCPTAAARAYDSRRLTCPI